MSPKLRTGAKTPERVPTTTLAVPALIRRHLFRTLGIREGTMQDSYTIAESCVKLAGHCWRQCNFRDQKQRSTTGGQRHIDGVQIKPRSCRTR